MEDDEDEGEDEEDARDVGSGLEDKSSTPERQKKTRLSGYCISACGPNGHRCESGGVARWERRGVRNGAGQMVQPW